MLAFLREQNTAATVIASFAFLRKVLPEHVYHALFYVLLADNGSEFTNPKLIEYDDEGNQVSHLFYCDPNAPYQKPNVELNHEFIRRIIPKGHSMDDFTQSDIDFMLSNINSYGREKFGGKSPTQLFIESFGIEALHLLRQELVPADKIILNSSLFNQQLGE